MPPRVVVTGLGAVTPNGLDVPSSWAAWIAGSPGIGPLTHFDPEAVGLRTRAAGQVRNFLPEEHFDKKTERRLDRVMQFGRVAAAEALAHAGLAGPSGELDRTQVAPERVGVFVGTGIGGVGTLLREADVLREKGGGRVSPFLVPMILADSVAASIAIAHGLKGPNMAHLSACASGANSIGEAFEAIRRGAADVMVAGASEAAIVPTIVAGFENMGALSTFAGDPATASRPFDLARDGFVIGEGAGIVVLEREEFAAARGARIYARLVGYGATADAGHITAPSEDGTGIRTAIELALREAGAAPEDIVYVNAHGTSTPLNDAVESAALRLLFGPRADAVPVSSIKSMIGHLLGAGGAVEAVATVLTLFEGEMPPTINLHTPDPACDLDYVPNRARPLPARGLALSTALGFGGHNAALLLAPA